MSIWTKAFGLGMDDQPVHEELGPWGDIEVPVTKTFGPTFWSISPADRDYLTAQTTEEHNRLLNTYYPERDQIPNWRELGRQLEKEYPRYSDQDSQPRKNIGARSSVIQDMAYDKEHNLAMLKMGDTWYTYSATPDQFKNFLSSGSLEGEMNRIHNDRGSSMMKTSARKIPNFNTPIKIGNIF